MMLVLRLNATKCWFVVVLMVMLKSGKAAAICMSTDNGITDSNNNNCDWYYWDGWCGNYDTSTFSSNQMCCTCGGGYNYVDCVDTNDGHDNSVGDDCVWYNSNPSSCGNYDTGSFSSTEMCCVCGGGYTCFNTDNGETDSVGHGCDYYQQNTNWCGSDMYDTSTFSSYQMCCACGGGRSKRSCVDSNFDKASCKEYAEHPENCGQHENAYFRANEMCCNCGGGYTWNSTHSDLNWSNRTLPYDTSSGTTDTNGNGCAFYVKNPIQCDLANDHDFTASEQCTSCGGGESRVCQNTDRGATNIFGESCLDLAIRQAHGYTGACVNDFDTVNFSAIEMCCACGGGQTISRGETCHDTEGSALDSLQHTCHHPKYTTLGLHCGEYDDSDFTASEMCCACGGGTQLQCVNTNLDAVDSDNSTCSSYDSGKQCGTSDTSNFNSSEMCCVCGGGERWVPNTASWNSTKTECYDDDTMLLGSSFDTCDGTGRNSCDIVGDPIKCCECQGGLPKSCENTDEQGVTNAIGLSCSDIALHVRYGDNSMCGPDLDTSEFSSDLMCCACAGGIRTGDICVSIQDPEQDECWPAGSLTSTPSFERCVNFQEQFPCSDSIVAGYRDADTLGQLNSKGFSCADVRDIFNLGHSDVCSDIYDTRYFTSTEMCTICGGGVHLYTKNLGGTIQLNRPLAQSSETLSSTSSSSCDLLVQRVDGALGKANATISLIPTNNVLDSDVCSQSQYADLSVSDDLETLSSFTVSWEDQDDSDQCLHFTVVDDDINEEDEAICVVIKQVQGAAMISTTGDTSALFVVVDNDEKSIDLTITIVLPTMSVLVVVVILAVIRRRIARRNEIASYIPIRRTIEVSQNTENQIVSMLESMLPQKNRHQQAQQHFMTRLESTTLKAEKIERSDWETFAESWHYIISTESKRCEDVCRIFLDKHRPLVATLANLRDRKGRKAIHVALKVQREDFEKHLLLCGRYRIDKGPVVHRSKTCEVVFAIDVKDKTSAHPDGRNVAIKMMKDRHQWECEIRARQKYKLDSCVVRLLGWHAPKDEQNTMIKGKGARIEVIKASSQYKYLLILEKGDSSVHRAIVTQRIAGHNVDAVSHLALEVAQNVKELHAAGLVHYDLKIRNIIVSSSLSEEATKRKAYCTSSRVMLCDLDAASPIGSIRSAKDKPGSSAYYAPEVARWHVSLKRSEKDEEEKGKYNFDTELCNKTSLDVWSYGVILFELCTGRALFPQDLNDDSMILDADETRLCLWSCIDEALLDDVFKNSASCNDERRFQAQQLIRWCLQGDPSKRPSFQDIVKHPFLNSFKDIQRTQSEDVMMDIVAPDRNTIARSRPSRIEYTTKMFQRFESLRDFAPQNMRYHFFITHMQAEASGDVGTLYHLFASMGINCWRDMNLKGEITEAAMKKGIQDSEAVILFLTNAFLSRPWCLKEIEWAIDFQKPIFVVVEREDRFWCWDIERWRTNRCTRDSNNRWVEGWLARTYKDCPLKVRKFIEHQYNSGLMLPFRRRSFEVTALVQEICRRVRITGCVPWGGTLPFDRAMIRAKSMAHPRLYVLHDTISKTASCMADQTYKTIKRILPKCRSVFKIESATYVVILLTRNVLNHGSRSLRELLHATSELKKSMLTFVYLNEGNESWDWSLPSKVSIKDEKRKAEFQTAICGREAYIWRSFDTHQYEHDALMKDIAVKRITRFEDEDEDNDEAQYDECELRLNVIHGTTSDKFGRKHMSTIDSTAKDSVVISSSEKNDEDEDESHEHKIVKRPLKLPPLSSLVKKAASSVGLKKNVKVHPI